ncbi:alpha/beta fold hydrolase [Streptomyces finlayi]|nr:alpha/beta hydrolase [Streptomyces finlayi]
MNKPTVVLVHGAFADASSWDAVTRLLLERGHLVIAVANPLRGLAHDAAYLRSLLTSVSGPVILVGHSYGGAVISEAATGAGNVCALVFVAAFAPDEGESAGSLDAKYGGPAAQISRPLPLPLLPGQASDPDGAPNIELIVEPDRFGAVFAPDVDTATAAAMAVAQRPITLAALTEPAGPPAWKTLPSYFVVATADRMIPADGQREMAARAGATVVEVPTGHVAMLHRADAIVDLISTAAHHH